MTALWSILILAGGTLASSPTAPVADETSSASFDASTLLQSTYVPSIINLQPTEVPSAISHSNSPTSSYSSITPAVYAAASNAPVISDLTKLFGADNTPTVDHVADSEDTANDSQKGLGGSLYIQVLTRLAEFKVAATVLLALVKCQAQGEWIKSMFQPANSEESVDQGGQFATVILLGRGTTGAEWAPWSKQLSREDLTMVAAEGFERDPQADGPDFDNPWWPWALTEGALEAGWAPTDTEYHWDDLLRILTGEEVELKDTEDIDSETTWNNYLSKADWTPVLIEWDGHWSVVMSPAVRDGVRWLGWADPYGRHHRNYNDNNEDDGRLTVFTKYDTFPKITKVMHLKNFASFDGRPEILGGS